jgi:DNA-binding transcriptional LysR family regulator
VYFGEVSIGLAGMFATHVADEAIAGVLSKRPNLRLQITEGLFEDMLVDLEFGRLDLMFANFPRVKVHPDIKLEPLVELHHAMLVRSDHPLARKRREITLADLLDERWLLIDQVHASLNFEGAFDRADLAPPEHVLRTNSLTLIRSLMGEGNHVACMPEEFFAQELRDGVLKRLSVPQFTFPRRAGLLYRGAAYQPPAVVEVMDALRASAANRGRGQRA